MWREQDSYPLVSCIMPTRDRRKFVSQAIWYFLYQDYPARELIIIDDGTDAVGDLIPNDGRIRYIRLNTPVDLATKRQKACELSQGAFIAHWDDDDWHAPQRLTTQIQTLQANQSDICAITPVLYYDVYDGKSWSLRQSHTIHQGTLLYRRERWQSHTNGTWNIDLPATKTSSPSPHLLCFVENDNLCIAVIHKHNNYAAQPTNHLWQTHSLSRVLQLIDAEQDFYVSLRNAGNRTTIKLSKDPAVTLVAPFLVYDGYGSIAEYLALSMAQSGAWVNPQALTIDRRGLSPEFGALMEKSRVNPNDPIIFFCWITGDLSRYVHSPNLFINTMWESNRLPHGWTEQINRAAAVIVPTRFVARTFRENGVLRPIYVIPEGVNPTIYSYIERPQRLGVTTLMVCTLIERKHWREAIAAWELAFANDPEARLLIKSHFGHHSEIPSNKRIHFVDDNEPTRGIAHWYQQADILLALGSEGFGLPLVEGMATGLPVVALNAEGQADVCEDAADYVLPVKPARYAPYDDQRFGRCGEFAIPDVEQAAAHLRWVVTHWEAAQQMGKAASRWVHAHRNIWDKGAKVLDVLEQHITPPRVLRRLPTLIVPSWKTQCGVAEYTNFLTQGLSNVRVLSRYEPDYPAQIVHFQHEYSLYQHTAFVKLVQHIRQANRPIVITEHSIMPHIVEPWEQDADALVALTSSGAAQLRQRWHNKPVYHIPIGMPTWFPRRKRKRERVIGVFGFLERHKGMWQLLDILRQYPDLSLKMYSVAKSPNLLEQWRQDSAGLAVEHVSDYLPEAKIAAQLAAEADILVYWYDSLPFYLASAAVCTGLATGVPVLTSPTHIFEDLRDVTYQPDELGAGIQTLLDNTQLRQQLTTAAREYCFSNSWQKITQAHEELWSNHRS